MRKIKGFSLIECIIAIAILGIASLTMAEIYAGVSRTNLDNHLVNTSLSYQMKMVEQKIKANTDTIWISSNEPGTVKDDAGNKTPGTVPNVPGKTSPDPPHSNSTRKTTTKYVKITKLDSSGNPTNESYSYPVDTFVLLSRDSADRPSSNPNSTIEENDIGLRYKYIIGSAK